MSIVHHGGGVHRTTVHAITATSGRPAVGYRPAREFRVSLLRYPHAPLARRAARIRAEREAAARIPREHLPVRRLRFVIALGLFPILWFLPRCGHSRCGEPWPCNPLIAHLRRVHGWHGGIQHHVHALATRRRRRRATRRNPGAVTHRRVRTGATRA
ncbi:hypothetical protein LX16_5192 [Stackebrandtia albiflava]|uniref:Uncharacterized protein n=1 Tax=Stackebrandtia albiflava TaxID=406432 RepID=A0A562ULI6_9ACTN|nr:hypothetical protein [Stackebrandtia albiflava]TWJ06456.1 hypothetical protein LX16_5192 [Stackebrandtia albiflava]